MKPITATDLTPDPPREKRESVHERELREGVERLNGLCEKFLGYGRPDDIVTWPTGEIHFVEVKRRKGKLADHQIRDHAARRARRVPVYTLYTSKEVAGYLHTHRRMADIRIML